MAAAGQHYRWRINSKQNRINQKIVCSPKAKLCVPCLISVVDLTRVVGVAKVVEVVGVVEVVEVVRERTLITYTL